MNSAVSYFRYVILKTYLYFCPNAKKIFKIMFWLTSAYNKHISPRLWLREFSEYSLEYEYIAFDS